jgi:hypothetical protein
MRLVARVDLLRRIGSSHHQNDLSGQDQAVRRRVPVRTSENY